MTARCAASGSLAGARRLSESWPFYVMLGGVIFGIGAVVFMPLFYGVAGLIGGLIGSLLYNAAAGLFGGFVLEVEG